MELNNVYNIMSEYIVKIETPDCFGTGFLCFINNDKTLYGIATAAHVIQRAHRWEQPIVLTHYNTKHSIILRPDVRAIFFGDLDSAVIVFSTTAFPFSFSLDKLPKFSESIVPIGNTVSWMGFPCISPDTLCLFKGIISANVKGDCNAYLIDGVSINGVSGGPIVFINTDGDIKVIGIVNSYGVNRSTGESLPGLLYAQDVSSFDKVVHDLNSLNNYNENIET